MTRGAGPKPVTNDARGRSYHDLIDESSDASAVKKAFIDIHSAYTRYDTDGNKR